MLFRTLHVPHREHEIGTASDPVKAHDARLHGCKNARMQEMLNPLIGDRDQLNRIALESSCLLCIIRISVTEAYTRLQS